MSISARTTDDATLIKTYRGIEPATRQQRESEALQIAPMLGIAAPQVIDHGCINGQPWTAIEIVLGEPGDICDSGAAFMSRTATVTGLLHRHEAMSGPGRGWLGAASGGRLTNAAHLASQLSPRVHAMSWWPVLAAALNTLDDQPTVYLHGDLKPEHIIATTSDLYVVDWEACGRGPAACDHADALFHLARDLVYSGHQVDELVLPGLPAPGLSLLLAWRLALWADRRRSSDLSRLPSEAIDALIMEEDLDTMTATVVAAIRHMREHGTPR